MARELGLHKGKVDLESFGDLLDQGFVPRCSPVASFMGDGDKDQHGPSIRHTGASATKREAPAHLEG